MKSKLQSLFPDFPASVLRLAVCILPVLLISVKADAQYFGRNKVNYRNFKFNVLETPNFELYHYLDDSTSRALAQASERWYKMHSQVLKDTISFKNPIIFYSNHADFQQTAAISGNISIGTGGVTEGLKNRVVMPVMDSWAKTDHVLGHELVHAFQYNVLKSDTSMSLRNIQNLPLWMVEGMAEYMSLGREDAHTAMWMRDAVYNKDIPTLRDLSTNPKYFPYRYGQAFWALIAGVWGDQMIEPLFKATAKYGLEHAMDSLIHTNPETFSMLWAKALTRHYERLFPDSLEQFVGTKLIHDGNTGDMNLAPMISPDGKKVSFFSEKKVFSVDMFVADAETGEIERSVYSSVRNSHIDDYNFLESGASWSFDSKYLAFVTVSKGKNKLVILNADKGKVEDEFFLKGLPAFSTPSWSPDGKNILVSGQVMGQTDLFLVNIKTQTFKKLTDDRYAEIQPQFSPDGKQIVFSTDRLSLENGSKNGKYSFNLAVLDLESGTKTDIEIFPGANNLNPVYASDGQEILFLSNRDGFRNLYAYSLEKEKVYQMTRLITGISGITEYSPAVSYSDANQKVLYSHYGRQKYTIYSAHIDEFDRREVDPMKTDFRASTLPPASPQDEEILVNSLLSEKDHLEDIPSDSIKDVPYRPKFQLDYIGNTSGVGVTASRFGTGIAGGVEALASDILGNNQLFGGLSINGEIYDFGGVFAYQNRSNRINWGLSASHVPYRYGLQGYEKTYIQDAKGDSLAVDNLYFDLVRMFQDKLSVFGYYPISSTMRVEAGGAMLWFYTRVDRFNNYYENGFSIGQNKEKLESPDGYNLQQLDVALVKDNSYFGMVSPLRGERYRVGFEQYFGAYNFYSFLADYRKYWFIQPATIAVRAYHYGRYGTNAEIASLYPVSLAFPQYMHGIQNISLDPSRADSEELTNEDFIGSKIFLTNFEFRLPFTGPEKLSLIKSDYFLTELAFFFDAGLMLNDEIVLGRVKQEDGSHDFQAGIDVERILQRKPIFSTGVGLRFNFFGQMILEPYYAIPFTTDKFYKGSFGLNFIPGW